MKTDATFSSQLAVLGVSQVALGELIAAQLAIQAVDCIKENCRKSVYWREFCEAVKADNVREDFLPGALGRCVLAWAREDSHFVSAASQPPLRDRRAKHGQRNSLWVTHSAQDKCERKLTDCLHSPYWFCRDCERVCERVESEHGQPASCNRCGSHRIELQSAIFKESAGSVAAQ